MKKQIFVLFVSFFFLCINANAQTFFENGYFINNEGEKTDCLIKNVDWRNNPIEIEYKNSKSEKEKILKLKAVKEFGIYDASKYERALVNIDRSKDDILFLSLKKEPIFQEELLFLKVLVEGKANLYQYVDGELKRFFYKTETVNLEQLVYKSYKTRKNKVGKNTAFRSQIWENVKCPDMDIKYLGKIDYDKKELVKLFVKYNNCNGSNAVDFEKKVKRDPFNLTLRAGVGSSTLSTIQGSAFGSADTEFNRAFGPRIGVEFEFVMPFNNNRWSIVLGGTFQSYNSEPTEASKNLMINYKSIEFPFGVRHSFFLNEKNNIFLDAFYCFDRTINSKLKREIEGDLKISSDRNYSFGVGYEYNKKLSIEVRYGLARNLLTSYSGWRSKYRSISFVFGYTLL